MDIRKAVALVMIATGLVIAPFVAFAAVDSDWEVSNWFDDHDHSWHDGPDIRFNSDWHHDDFDDLDVDFSWHDDDFGIDFDDLDIDLDWDDDLDIDISWTGDTDYPRDSNGIWQSADGDWQIRWEDGSINIDFSGDTDD